MLGVCCCEASILDSLSIYLFVSMLPQINGTDSDIAVGSSWEGYDESDQSTRWPMLTLQEK